MRMRTTTRALRHLTVTDRPLPAIAAPSRRAVLLGAGTIGAGMTLGMGPASAAPTLRKGSKGAAVTTLQKDLAGLKYWLGAADGSFGHLTQQAVYALQKVAGLSADGVVGPKTYAAIASGARPLAQDHLGRRLRGGSRAADHRRHHGREALLHPEHLDRQREALLLGRPLEDRDHADGRLHDVQPVQQGLAERSRWAACTAPATTTGAGRSTGRTRSRPLPPPTAAAASPSPRATCCGHGSGSSRAGACSSTERRVHDQFMSRCWSSRP